MAAVNLPAAFAYKWAENGTVDVLDDSQYKLGWAFIGSTPPSVEQFNKVLQIIDEKANYLNSSFGNLLASSGWQRLPGGLIMQWMSISTGLVPGGNVLLPLPISFPNEKILAIASPGNSGRFNNSQVGASIGGGTLGQIDIYSGTGAQTAYVFVLGR